MSNKNKSQDKVRNNNDEKPSNSKVDFSIELNNNEEETELSDEVLQQIETNLKEGKFREKKETVEVHEEEDNPLMPATAPDEAKTDDIKTKKKKKQKKPYEKTTFAHKMRVLAVLLVLGVFTGSGLGVWYFNVSLRPSTDYGKYQISKYQGNVNTVLENEFGVTSNRENWYSHVGEKTPKDLSPVDNFLLATYNATLAKSFIFIGNGESVAMGISQTVYSKRRYNGKTYTFESISKGVLSIANLDVFEKGSSKIDIYRGSNISRRDADWNYNRTLTTDEYYDLTGSLPSGITPYIISDKTVISSEESIDEENGTYTYTFILDPITSVLLYYKEVRRTGDLNGDPEFKSVKYIMTIDSQWNLISTEVFEEYSAIKLGLNNQCKGTIKIDYNFNIDYVEMPKLRGK